MDGLLGNTKTISGDLRKQVVTVKHHLHIMLIIFKLFVANLMREKLTPKTY